ncbi:MAG: hypothetical protein ACO35F_04795 [Ilumatobacteraceae bacterium]
MSPQLLLLLAAVLLGVIAALVWWRRGKLEELPVLTPEAAQAAPDGREVIVTGLAGGETGTSPYTGASGLLFEAEEVTEWTEPRRDDETSDRQERRTRNLGTSGSLMFIEEAGSRVEVRSGSNFDITGFPETRTASERSTNLSFGGDSAFSISSGNRRTWVEERVVRSNDRVWVRGMLRGGALDGSEKKLQVSGTSVAAQLRQQFIAVVVLSVLAVAALAGSFFV